MRPPARPARIVPCDSCGLAAWVAKRVPHPLCRACAATPPWVQVVDRRFLLPAERVRLLRAFADGVEMECLIERFGGTLEAIQRFCERAGVRRPLWFQGGRSAA